MRLRNFQFAVTILLAFERTGAFVALSELWIWQPVEIALKAYVKDLAGLTLPGSFSTKA